MYRVKRVARALVTVVLVVVVMLFVPPVRNVLTLGYLPRRWRDVPTYQLLKVYMSSVRSPGSALAACTQPARATSGATGHHDPLLRLLTSEPFQKLRARPRDEAAYSRAWTWLNQSAERRQRYLGFAPKLTPLQKAQMLLTWRVLHEALTLHNITHFLIDGSLMGAVRHGGIIPWDDDMDVALDEQDLDKVKRALSCVPGYTLRISQSLHWKFFADDAQVMNLLSKAPVLHPRELEENEKKDYVPEWRPFDDVVVRSPFVDLYMATRDEAHTWCLTEYNINTCLYRLDDVYPLTQVNFDGYPAPVPRRSAAILRSTYDTSTCISSSFSHMEGAVITERSVTPCGELALMHTVYSVE